MKVSKVSPEISSLKSPMTTHPIFALADLEDTELLTASAQHDETSDFVVNFVCLVLGFLLPFRSQCNEELFPIDEAAALKLFSNCLDFVALRWCFCKIIKL
jgi:hypothetical protein